MDFASFRLQLVAEKYVPIKNGFEHGVSLKVKLETGDLAQAAKPGRRKGTRENAETLKS
jgi:hypothetical protein